MAKTQRPDAIGLDDGRFKFQFQPEKFWQGLRGALLDFFDGNAAGGTDRLLQSLGSFSQTDALEHKAFTLIFRALHKACRAILTENAEQQRILEAIGAAGIRNAELLQTQQQRLSAGTYELSADFFANPMHDPLVRDARADFQLFLETVLALEPAQAGALAATLPGRFVQELAAEWNNGNYQPIVDHFKNNPVLPALQRLAERQKRHAELLLRYAKPAFDDPKIALAEMYIEPAFLLHKKCIQEAQRDAFGQENAGHEHSDFFKPQEDQLHRFFQHWTQGKLPPGFNATQNRFLILLGQPGQGKTSFFLRTAFQLLHEHDDPEVVENLHFLRLRDVVQVQQLLDDPLEVVCKNLRIGPQPEEQQYLLRNGLILLDGLDELYMSQGLGLDQIHDIVRKLRKELDNRPELNLRIALSSRTNYLKLDTLDAGNYLVLHLADLSLEQQKDWLAKYRRHRPDCLLHAEDLERIAASNDVTYAKVRGLLSQPILLQIVADSGVPVDAGTNSARVYQQMFDKVIEKVVRRDWSPQDGPLDVFQQLKTGDLRRFLQVLALHIFQKKSNHEYARRTDFIQAGPLRDAAEALREKAGQGALEIKELVKHLLVSFYFQEVRRDPEEKRQSGEHDEYAYEFLHKSLQEYLVAEHIWDSCEEAFLDTDRRGKYRVQKAEEAMAVLTPLFQRKILSQEIADYLHGIVQNSTADKRSLRNRLREIFPLLLEQHFLFEHKALEGEPTALEKMLANFYGFWSLASALIKEDAAVPKEELNLIPEDLKNDFVHLVMVLLRVNYRQLNLCFQDLSGADLRGAYLGGTDLSGTDLNGTDLSGAYFRGAGLSEADLRWADLRRADLRETYLRWADLSRADLSRADLSMAYLGGATLSGANLTGANLTGSDLSEADLRRADLSRASLHVANFENADLEGAVGRASALGASLANFNGTIWEGKFTKEK